MNFYGLPDIAVGARAQLAAPVYGALGRLGDAAAAAAESDTPPAYALIDTGRGYSVAALPAGWEPRGNESGVDFQPYRGGTLFRYWRFKTVTQGSGAYNLRTVRVKDYGRNRKLPHPRAWNSVSEHGPIPSLQEAAPPKVAVGNAPLVTATNIAQQQAAAAVEQATGLPAGSPAVVQLVTAQPVTPAALQASAVQATYAGATPNVAPLVDAGLLPAETAAAALGPSTTRPNLPTFTALPQGSTPGPGGLIRVDPPRPADQRTPAERFASLNPAQRLAELSKTGLVLSPVADSGGRLLEFNDAGTRGFFDTITGAIADAAGRLFVPGFAGGGVDPFPPEGAGGGGGGAGGSSAGGGGGGAGGPGPAAGLFHPASLMLLGVAVILATSRRKGAKR